MRNGFPAILDDVGKGPFHAAEDGDASNEHHDGGTNGDCKQVSTWERCSEKGCTDELKVARHRVEEHKPDKFAGVEGCRNDYG